MKQVPSSEGSEMVFRSHDTRDSQKLRMDYLSKVGNALRQARPVVLVFLDQCRSALLSQEPWWWGLVVHVLILEDLEVLEVGFEST